MRTSKRAQSAGRRRRSSPMFFLANRRSSASVSLTANCKPPDKAVFTALAAATLCSAPKTLFAVSSEGVSLIVTDRPPFAWLITAGPASKSVRPNVYSPPAFGRALPACDLFCIYVSIVLFKKLILELVGRQLFVVIRLRAISFCKDLDNNFA